MRIILNTTTNYQQALLKKGTEIDIELKVAQRWINAGIAHPAPEKKKELSPKAKKLIKEYKKKAEAKNENNNEGKDLLRGEDF